MFLAEQQANNWQGYAATGGTDEQNRSKCKMMFPITKHLGIWEILIIIIFFNTV